jgi:hypothetical protein
VYSRHQTFTQNVSADKHIFKLGVNDNAAAPVIAKY